MVGSPPMVSVPVLSKTTHSIRLAFSNASPPPLARMPCFAASPLPTKMAVGAARARPHGQATTKTAMANCRENATHLPEVTSKKCPGIRPLRPSESQTIQVMTARKVTTGTKYDVSTSATRSIGARFVWPSRTTSTIWSSIDRPDVPVMRTRSGGPLLTVPEKTSSPGRFLTGRDSPVRLDSSKLLSPLTTVPSAGGEAPWVTRTTSP
ncbi:hypothetical protein VTK26DRAFT_8618 [Humicola hyalothermophila]